MDESAEVMSLLARAVGHRGTQEPLVQRLCRACVDILGSGGAAITLATTRPESLTIWATDQMSAALESLQHGDQILRQDRFLLSGRRGVLVADAGHNGGDGAVLAVERLAALGIVPS